MSYRKNTKRQGQPKQKDIVRRILSSNVRRQIKQKSAAYMYELLECEQLYVRDESGRAFHELTDEDVKRYILHADSNVRLLETLHIKGRQEEQAGQYISIRDAFMHRYLVLARGCLPGSKWYMATGERERIGLEQKIDDFARECACSISVDSSVITPELLFTCLEKNENCKELITIMGKQAVLREIPRDLTMLFPHARAMDRHFILHVGDTNSGKTYEATQELMQAASGVYLAPLRLLAMEVQERLNGLGVTCSLLTGEEEELLENATHMSSTVEMLNMDREYEVCVLDEAQMIADDGRGWAWTKAVLGVCAKRVHVCMSENARGIVEALIASCGDTSEVVLHQRDTPLEFEWEFFDFPSSIRKHDALIAFSRKKVLSIAAELDEEGIKASVIYGSLPYSVRKNEIQKFLDGDTDVVVSTDAIGMGMNLPVERIVFLEDKKFDGRRQRSLTGPEVKQIAGRAGRRGIYQKGFVNALTGKDELYRLFGERYQPIRRARLQMPERLLLMEMPLTDTIEAWLSTVDVDLYEKSDMELILKKCRYLETLDGLSKEDMWRFSLIPFNEVSYELYDLWKYFVRCYCNGDDMADDLTYRLSDGKRLTDLEMDYKKLDLYYSFARVIGYDKDHFRSRVVKLKEEISAQIMSKLRNVSTEKKKCRYCGRVLSWNYKYDACNACAYLSKSGLLNSAHYAGRRRRR